MQASARSRSICESCSSKLFFLFKNGFCSAPRIQVGNLEKQLHLRKAFHGGSFWIKYKPNKTSLISPKYPNDKFSGSLRIRQVSTGISHGTENGTLESSLAANSIPYAQLEEIARRARQTFGETLPQDFLRPEEYEIYERLYGPPTGITSLEDISLLYGLQDGHKGAGTAEGQQPRNTLFTEDAQGNLKEVEYELSKPEKPFDILAEQELGSSTVKKNHDYLTRLGNTTLEQGNTLNAAVETAGDHLEIDQGELETAGVGEALERGDITVDINELDFEARLVRYRDMADAERAIKLQNAQLQDPETVEEEEEDIIVNEDEDDSYESQNFDEGTNDPREVDDLNETDDTLRSHPLTSLGRSNTFPATLEMPKETIVNPITSLLVGASNKHLKEVAQKVFGGPSLPNSTATPHLKPPHLEQRPIALEASKLRMSKMEANVYMIGNIPSTYAVVMNTLVEVRKRLGPQWVSGLLNKDKGPLILDAGGGGASILAWREIVLAESKLLNRHLEPTLAPAKLGEPTVVVGSPALRHISSRLLENTTFLPRLPDYNPSLNHPSQENPKASPKKRYDIIIAPHTLWSLSRDYMRKNQVHNLWSLLNPNGGVLILIEKGVPRGFELIADARETLLKYHIASPDLPMTENQIDEPSEGAREKKETGMIIAPCTNHYKCPLYHVHGQSKGRKDFCRFTQRFLRPHFLQQVLGAKERNHEDVQFSYIAVQRGVDQRQNLAIIQGPAATEAAFTGYEDKKIENENSEGTTQKPDTVASGFHPLSLPRILLTPLKRRGHTTMDLCTPSAKLERWTVPKSFGKQAFRDARKSRWGDLWALGAKTRVPRNVRLGKAEQVVKNVKSRESSSKRTRQLDRDQGGADDDDDDVF